MNLNDCFCPGCGSLFLRTESGCVCPKAVYGECEKGKIFRPVPGSKLKLASLPETYRIGVRKWSVNGKDCKRVKASAWRAVAGDGQVKARYIKRDGRWGVGLFEDLSHGKRKRSDVP